MTDNKRDALMCCLFGGFFGAFAFYCLSAHRSQMAVVCALLCVSMAWHYHCLFRPGARYAAVVPDPETEGRA